jgi:bacterioferritin-associated ferredoxin
VAAVIVCVCNALRESQVRTAARSVTGCAKAAYAELGCKPQCGQCLPFAQAIVRQEQAAISN